MRIINSLLYLVAPQRCLLCQALSSDRLCFRCKPSAQITVRHNQLCPQCGGPRPEKGPCLLCTLHPLPFSSLHALWYYDDMVRDLICLAKYQPNLFAMNELCRRFRHYCKETILPEVDGIYALPPSALHDKNRPFEVGATLARCVANELNKKLYTGLLLRNSKRNAQASLNAQRRIAGLSRLYTVTKIPPVRSLLLIDDVLTTGATMSTAALHFAQAGIAVHVLVLACHRNFSVNRAPLIKNLKRLEKKISVSA